MLLTVRQRRNGPKTMSQDRFQQDHSFKQEPQYHINSNYDIMETNL